MNLFRNYNSNCFIVWSITTIDEKIKRIIEPGTPPTTRVFETIMKFVDSGIKCCVNIDPIIPFITDGQEHIASIVDKCQQVGIRYISGSVLRLRHDIWVRIKEILNYLEYLGRLKSMKEYMVFKNLFTHENNQSANKTYIDKVLNNLKDEVSKRNIVFGFSELIEELTKVKQDYTISSKQCRISEFV